MIYSELNTPILAEFSNCCSTGTSMKVKHSWKQVSRNMTKRSKEQSFWHESQSTKMFVGCIFSSAGGICKIHHACPSLSVVVRAGWFHWKRPLLVFSQWQWWVERALLPVSSCHGQENSRGILQQNQPCKASVLLSLWRWVWAKWAEAVFQWDKPRPLSPCGLHLLLLHRLLVKDEQCEELWT